MLHLLKENYIPAESRKENRGKFIHAAEVAARNAPPRTYQVLRSRNPQLNNPNRPFSFFVFGCQGNAKKAQQQVAELMRQIALDPTKKPDFILILGDNFYDFGVDGPDDKAFYTHFEKIYAGVAALKIPCFILLGNHDENLHKLALLEPEKGVIRGLHQVARSYMPEISEPYNTFQSKTELYAQEILYLDELPFWNLPARAYSLIFGNTQLFCLDTNTYLADFIAWQQGSADEFNQARWLAQEYQKAQAAGRRILLAGHQPLLTLGKRAYKTDLSTYLNKAARHWLLENYGLEGSHAEVFYRILKYQHLHFDVAFAAHDHDIYYINDQLSDHDYPLCQLISGGGGGKLGERFYFANPQTVGCFFRKHGFAQVTCDEDKNVTHFSIYTVKQPYHLAFSNQSSQALRSFPPTLSSAEQSAVNDLTAAVNLALMNYFQFLADQQYQHQGQFFSLRPKLGNITHGMEGINRAHEIWAYINNYSADDYSKTVETLYHLAKWEQDFISTYITNPSAHSFIHYLNSALSSNSNRPMTLEKLYQESKGYEILDGELEMEDFMGLTV